MYYNCCNDRFVREAAIFAFCMVLMSVPPIYLHNEMSLQMVELQLWLKGIQFFKQFFQMSIHLQLSPIDVFRHNGKGG